MTRWVSVTSAVTGASSSPSPVEQQRLEDDGDGEEHEPAVEVQVAADRVDDREGQQHREGQEVLDTLGQHHAQDPQLARQVGRPDELGLLDERARRVGQAAREPLPAEQADDEEEEVRLVADVTALEDVDEDEVVDQRHQQRVEDRPEVAEDAAGVADSQVAHDEGRQHAAPGHDGLGAGDQPHLSLPRRAPSGRAAAPRQPRAGRRGPRVRHSAGILVATRLPTNGHHDPADLRPAPSRGRGQRDVGAQCRVSPCWRRCASGAGCSQPPCSSTTSRMPRSTPSTTVRSRGSTTARWPRSTVTSSVRAWRCSAGCSS